MQWMNPPESGACTYESCASEEQRKENEKAMEERRDILVAAIEEHDDYQQLMNSENVSPLGAPPTHQFREWADPLILPDEATSTGLSPLLFDRSLLGHSPAAGR